MLISKYGDLEAMRSKRLKKQIKKTYSRFNRSVRIFHCKNCGCHFSVNFFEGEWSWDGTQAISNCPCCHEKVKKIDLIGPPKNNKKWRKDK